MASSSNAANASKAPMQDYHPGNPAPNLSTEVTGSSAPKKKKKKHRGGKKRNRRQSFAAPPGQLHPAEMTEDTQSLLSAADETAARASFYRIARGNDSNTSLESEALLDHRDQGPLNARRQSIQQSLYSQRNTPYARHPSHLSPTNPFSSPTQNRPKLSRPVKSTDRGSDGEDSADDRTPLMSTSRKESPSRPSYGGFMGRNNSSHDRDFRRPSTASSRSSQKRKTIFDGGSQVLSVPGEYDVNNPPSVPGSPVLGPDMGYEDVMLPRRSSSPGHRSGDALGNNVIINIDEPDSPTPMEASLNKRRQTISGLPMLEDVCFPLDNMSEIGNEDVQQRESEEPRPRRRRTRKWPHLPALEEWTSEEKEQRTMGGIRTRKVSEPLMVGGRLRPQKQVWHREDDDAPYRFTYFNEEFQSTVHSQTISELLQSGQTFRDLFIPERPVLSDSSSGEEDEEDDDLLTGGALLPDLGNNDALNSGNKSVKSPPPGLAQAKGEDIGSPGPAKISSSGEQTRSQSPQRPPKQKRYGPRPVFWLDVLSPTDEEMRVISKAFGIHPLTAEDIMMQEAREKVELFRHYYFVNYRTFEQDTNSEDYLEPVNMYVVVFREGVISFHFSLTPHPANVRRRIRQLSDYLILSSDWISYAIIDDITDVYAPLIERIEDEVDNIDDKILGMHTSDEDAEAKARKDKYNNEFEKGSDSGESLGSSDGNMLRRVGECRKKVMGLYRLLGNKADVIKGFAKRCNEQWDVAPRSEIGLYLGDIQDHIVTMTGNLSHYENLLSRAHSNYLTQVNLKMSDRAERNADILGKLTVLGTIVLPLNIVTGLFGMNTRVPGESGEGLGWFWGITGGMAAFAIVCYFIAKKMYGIV